MKRKITKYIAKLLGQQIIFLDEAPLHKINEEIHQIKTLKSQVRVDNNLLISAKTSQQIENLKYRFFKEALTSMINDFSKSAVWYKTIRGIETDYDIEITVLTPKSNKHPFINTDQLF